MKRMKKHVLALLLVVFTVAGMLGSVTTEAAAPTLYEKSVTCYVMKPLMSYVYDVVGVKEKKQITNLKSSNPSVATVTTDKISGSTNASILVKAKKTGKTVITFTAKYGAGLKKSKKLTLNVTVKKYENPCKSFKIGSREYVSLLKQTTFGHTENPKKTAKVSVKAKSGWKLDHVYVMNKNGKMKNIKNNSKLNTKSYPSVYATFVNRKTGEYQSVGIIMN